MNKQYKLQTIQSKIGKIPITIDDSIQFEFCNNNTKLLISNGDKKIATYWTPDFTIKLTNTNNIKYFNIILNNNIIIHNIKHYKKLCSIFGALRATVNNIVIGLKQPHSAIIYVSGVGYAITEDKDYIIFKTNKSHKDYVLKLNNIKYTLLDNINLKLECIDKQLLGNVLYKMEKLAYPNPYDLKGIKIKNKIYFSKSKKK